MTFAARRQDGREPLRQRANRAARGGGARRQLRQPEDDVSARNHHTPRPAGWQTGAAAGRCRALVAARGGVEQRVVGRIGVRQPARASDERAHHPPQEAIALDVDAHGARGAAGHERTARAVARRSVVRVLALRQPAAEGGVVAPRAGQRREQSVDARRLRLGVGVAARQEVGVLSRARREGRGNRAARGAREVPGAPGTGARRRRRGATPPRRAPATSRRRCTARARGSRRRRCARPTTASSRARRRSAARSRGWQAHHRALAVGLPGERVELRTEVREFERPRRALRGAPGAGGGGGVTPKGIGGDRPEIRLCLPPPTPARA